MTVAQTWTIERGGEVIPGALALTSRGSHADVQASIVDQGIRLEWGDPNGFRLLWAVDVSPRESSAARSIKIDLTFGLSSSSPASMKLLRGDPNAELKVLKPIAFSVLKDVAGKRFRVTAATSLMNAEEDVPYWVSVAFPAGDGAAAILSASIEVDESKCDFVLSRSDKLAVLQRLRHLASVGNPERVSECMAALDTLQDPFTQAEVIETFLQHLRSLGKLDFIILFCSAVRGGAHFDWWSRSAALFHEIAVHTERRRFLSVIWLYGAVALGYIRQNAYSPDRLELLRETYANALTESGVISSVKLERAAFGSGRVALEFSKSAGFSDFKLRLVLVLDGRVEIPFTLAFSRHQVRATRVLMFEGDAVERAEVNFADSMVAVAGSPVHAIKDDTPFSASAWTGAQIPAMPAIPGRQKVAVVAWDLGHNPAGRAFLLADMAARYNDVELIGPLFPAYNHGKIWGPIADADMSIRTFPATDLRSLVDGAISIAETVKCDIVYVSKPRLPSLLIGGFLQAVNKCPVIVDVDDHELSFCKQQETISFEELVAAHAKERSTADVPYSDAWTRYCEHLISRCDAITVSNVALQSRFGGTIVRHGRDELAFDPTLYDRAAARREFGYDETDRVILFLGTPRLHKGMFKVADALEELDDKRLVFSIIGSIQNKAISDRFAEYRKARISLHPDQPWTRLPELVSMADAVFVLQDPGSPISEYQIPAKVTDALALGVPVFVTPVPPLEDMISGGAVIPVKDDTDLNECLKAVASDRVPANQGTRRRYYEEELTYFVNASRIQECFGQARQRYVGDKLLPPDLVEYLRRRTGRSLSPNCGRSLKKPNLARHHPIDMVFHWKQNDSDLYGRRPDMICKYLLQSGRVRRILHFDAPMSLAALERQARAGAESSASQAGHIAVNTVRRYLRAADSYSLVRRTFVFGTRPDDTLFGRKLPPLSEYPDFIRQCLLEERIAPEPLLWVCPVVFEFPAVKDAVNPVAVVADIIDDQRKWPSAPAYLQRVEAAYSEVLQDADWVIANCEPVRSDFSAWRPDIMSVPNGLEIFDDLNTWTVPEDIAPLPRPILGYVGNLRDRVDWDLIQKIARAYPHGTVVLIGSAHGRSEISDLAREPNIKFLGVKAYNDALRYIKSFDVALMPHLANEISESMNPLKLYVYASVGVPIVTTAVANIEDVMPYIHIASTHEGFIASVQLALSEGRRDGTEVAVSHDLTWTSRISEVLRHIGLEDR